MSQSGSRNRCALCHYRLVEDGGVDLWSYRHLNKYLEGRQWREEAGFNSAGAAELPNLSYKLVTRSVSCSSNGLMEYGGNGGKEVPMEKAWRRICGACEKELSGLQKLDEELTGVKRRIEKKLELIKQKGGGRGGERLEELWRDKKAIETNCFFGVSTGLDNVRQTLKFLEGFCAIHEIQIDKPVNLTETQSQEFTAKSISASLWEPISSVGKLSKRKKRKKKNKSVLSALPQPSENSPEDVKNEKELQADNDNGDIRNLGGGSEKRRIIQYHRDFLIEIGLSDLVSKFETAELGFPTLVRGNNISNADQNQGNGSKKTGDPIVPPLPSYHVPLLTALFSRTRERVKVPKAKHVWRPAVLGGSTREGQNANKEAIAIENVLKMSRGILNKLTPANFDKLVLQFLALPLETKDECISSVISLVFEKAVSEPLYSLVYARLLEAFCKTSEETLKKKFRKQILDQCLKEFQKCSVNEACIKAMELKLEAVADGKTRQQLKLDLEEKRYLTRQRSLGKFIAELYKLQILSPKILVECVHLLLYDPDEKQLECLCVLLSIIGRKLHWQLKSFEAAISRGEKPKFVPEPKWMDKIFKELRELYEEKKFCWRVRFAVLDVVEVRDNQWKPRKNPNANAMET